MKYYTETLQVPLRNCIEPQYCSTFTNSYGYLWVLMGTWRVHQCPILPILSSLHPLVSDLLWELRDQGLHLHLEAVQPQAAQRFCDAEPPFVEAFFGGQKSLKLPGNPAYIACFAGVCRDLQKTIPILRTWFWGVATCSPFVVIMYIQWTGTILIFVATQR